MTTTENTQIARSINGMACDITVLISINSLYIGKMVSLELVRSRYPYFSIDSSRSCVVACSHREFAESMCVPCLYRTSGVHRTRAPATSRNARPAASASRIGRMNHRTARLQAGIVSSRRSRRLSRLATPTIWLGVRGADRTVPSHP